MTDTDLIRAVGTTDQDPDLTSRPVVDRTYPLEEAATAIQHLLDGKARGKLAVSVSTGHLHTPPPGSTP